MVSLGGARKNYYVEKMCHLQELTHLLFLFIHFSGGGEISNNSISTKRYTEE